MAEDTLTPHRSALHSYAWLIAIVGLLLLVGSGVVYILNHSWAAQVEIAGAFGIVLMLSAVLLRPDAVRMALTGRPVKYGSNAVVMSLAFIGILGFINFLSVKNNREYDLTETGQFTLSEQTVQILEKLDRPVQVIGFFQTNDYRSKWAKDYLERYSQYTDHLTYEFHDPNVEPALARSFDLSNYGLVFVSGSNHYETSGVDEQTITGGLLRVTSDAGKKVYFITGHGEPSISDTAPKGYSKVKQALERENYIVEEINLAAITGAVPADAAVLILAGPDRRLLDTEVQLIGDWMAADGKLMVLADPLEPAPLPQVLQKYGLVMGNGLVVDLKNYLVSLAPTAPVVVKYPYHEITRDLNGYLTFFPLARSLTISSTQESNHYATAILSTSPSSWAEVNLESSPLEYNEGVDSPGPINIGVAAEDRESGARLVVFGSAGFVANENLLDEVANRDLFINAVNWLAEEDDLISIRPKRPTDRRLFLTPLQNNITIFTTLVVIPASVFAAGIAIWWKRR